MRENSKSLLTLLTKPAVALGGAALIALGAIAVALTSHSFTPTGQYTRVVVAPITAVGGVSSDLSFQISGQVVSIPVALGQNVSAGAALVSLDQSALQATRAGAVANQEAAEARLATLLSGTRPEQLAINQTALTQAQISLRDTIRSAYLTADNAIHTTADQLFTNPRTASPALIFIPSDQVLQNAVLAERTALETMLSNWGVSVHDTSFDTNDPIVAAASAKANLAQISTFLNDVATLLTESTIQPATLQAYQASITAARLAVSGSVSALTGGSTAVQGAQGVLTLAEAGPTDNDIAAARAVVDAATAALRGIDVTLRESTLFAPVAGTVTTLNAHLGQTVAPGQILVSIESMGGRKDRALVVPTSSVITDGNQSFVYKKTNGAPVKTRITTGLVSTEGMTEIVNGLSEGDEVLTFGITT